MAVDGAALGAGFELALMADMLLASERATFGQPEIRLGSSLRRRRLAVGARGPRPGDRDHATGRTYSAAEMHALGIVSRVLPVEGLTPALDDVLKDPPARQPARHALNCGLVRRLRGRSFEEARLEAERVFLDELMATEDVREGIASSSRSAGPRGGTGEASLPRELRRRSASPGLRCGALGGLVGASLTGPAKTSSWSKSTRRASGC